LGVPFNIASYALLTCMIAQICNLKPGDFVYFMGIQILILGDTHIYKNHIEPLKLQIQRTPNKFPTLKLNKDVKNIDDFTFDDIKIEGYSPKDAIKMDMAV
jgi:thymidylate synthase